MKTLKRFFVRLFTALARRQDDARLREEVEAHIAFETAENLRAGMPPEEARRRALIKFGAAEAITEDYRDQASLPALENLLQDARYALRQFRRNPAFTCAAVLVPALGLCASVAIFAFVDAALLRPLPYQDPERLVGVYGSIPLCPRCNLSYPDYVDWKRANTVLRSFDVYEAFGFTVNTAEGAEQAPGAKVSAGFFRTLGVTPVLGRDFDAGEDVPEAPRTVILSYAAWLKRYGGRTDVLGQKVLLNSVSRTIIGVLPRDFHFGPSEEGEFWTALQPIGDCYARRSCHGEFAVARLKDGVSVEAAGANLRGIAQQLERQYPESNRGQSANVVALTDVLVGDIRPILLLLLGGAGLLLLIAGTNVASLLLVRSESRKREIAVRSALGGSTGRLVRQFATEALMLTAAATATGLVCARWMMVLLLRLIPQRMIAAMPYLHQVGFSIRVDVFAGALAAVTAVLFCVTPALHISATNLRDRLSAGDRGSAGTVWQRLGGKLVVVELATAVVLLVGAGLLSQSLYRLLRVDLGFQPQRLATLSVASSMYRYATNEQQIALQRRILSETASLPGAESAALSSRLPLLFGNTVWIRVAGRAFHGEHNEVSYRAVSPAYFTTLKARLIRGRYFREEEDPAAPRVVIIDRAMARKYFPGEDPIGQQLLYHSIASPPMQIIGIVDDIKEGAVDQEAWPAMYVDINQEPSNFYSLVVRTSQDAQAVLPELNSAIHKIDPMISVYAQQTMTQRIDDSPAAYLRRSSAWLVGGFAAVALLLSLVGLYGVVAYSVSQRTREIGVRMALGAAPASVYRLIVGEAAALAGMGTALGIAASLAAASLIRGLLFGIRSWDLPTLSGVAAVLVLSALLASFVPARRAASVNPVEALRAE